MASLTIRNLDDPLKALLRTKAAHNGRSMEEEARQILRAALASTSPKRNLADDIWNRFAPLGGVDLEVDDLRTETLREPPTFDQ